MSSILSSLEKRAQTAFDEALDTIRRSRVLSEQQRALFSCIEIGILPQYPRSPELSSSSRLTNREIEVTRLIVDGKTTSEIASLLEIAFKTVAAHRAHIMEKLQVSNSAALVREAFVRGIVA